MVTKGDNQDNGVDAESPTLGWALADVFNVMSRRVGISGRTEKF